jgi:hypothetical protein
LPKGKPVYGGSEPQPGDEQIGEWSPKRLIKMDERFVRAVRKALRHDARDVRRG